MQKRWERATNNLGNGLRFFELTCISAYWDPDFIFKTVPEEINGSFRNDSKTN